MGRIRGDLDVLGLAPLLEAIFQNHGSGTLTISIGEERKSIHFGESGLRLLATTRRKGSSLGEILLRTGKVTRAQLQEMLDEQRRAGGRLGEIGTSRGLVSPSDIENALRDQALEEVYDLFLWRGAQFDFAENTTPPHPETPLAEVILGVNLPSLTLEAARRRDELDRIRKIIRNGRLILSPTQQPPRLDDPNLDHAVAEAILPLVDGTRSIEEIVEASVHSEFQVLRTLYVLSTQGAVRPQELPGVRRVSDATTVILPAGPRPGQRRGILVVSGMPLFLAAVAGRLRAEGYDVYEETRPDAIEASLGRHRPDVAILDVSVDWADPVGGAAPLLASAHVPFLVLSANSNRDAVVQAIKSGARDYLIKPITDTILLQRLKSILGN